MAVAVYVAVYVIAPLIVAALVSGNDAVALIDAASDRASTAEPSERCADVLVRGLAMLAKSSIP